MFCFFFTLGYLTRLVVVPDLLLDLGLGLLLFPLLPLLLLPDPALLLGLFAVLAATAAARLAAHKKLENITTRTRG
jgi:hypothetical protein